MNNDDNNNQENNQNISNNIENLMNNDLFHFLIRSSINDGNFYNRHLVNSLFNRGFAMESSRDINEILRRSLLDKPRYKTVISDDGLQDLKYICFKESSKTNNQCPFYFTDFKDDDEIVELPCKHIFTKDSIEKWLKEESNECPICRDKLKSKEIEIKKDDDESDSDDEMPGLIEDDSDNDIEVNEEDLGHNNNFQEINARHYWHNPMQRYLIENIINETSHDNNIITSPTPLSYDTLDLDLQQALYESINEKKENDSNSENDNSDNDID